MPELQPIFALAVFFFGLAWGSFLNVCIYRLPRQRSVVRPRSACPHCRAPIGARDNVPVLSWLLLRGRCRHCRAPISPRYVAVELLTGALFLGVFLFFGPTLAALKFCIFGFLLLGLIFTDAELHLLPDALTYPGIALGMLFSLFTPPLVRPLLALSEGLPLSAALGFRIDTLLDSAAGAALGAAFIFAVGEAYFWLRHREGMGFGDVKLMAMIGAFLGVKLTALVLFLGSVVGSLAGIVLIAIAARTAARAASSSGKRRKEAALAVFQTREMPFGVFLGSMALLAVFAGGRILTWYLGLYR